MSQRSPIALQGLSGLRQELWAQLAEHSRDIQFSLAHAPRLSFWGTSPVGPSNSETASHVSALMCHLPPRSRHLPVRRILSVPRLGAREISTHSSPASPTPSRSARVWHRWLVMAKHSIFSISVLRLSSSTSRQERPPVLYGSAWPGLGSLVRFWLRPLEIPARFFSGPQLVSASRDFQHSFLFV